MCLNILHTCIHSMSTFTQCIWLCFYSKIGFYKHDGLSLSWLHVGITVHNGHDRQVHSKCTGAFVNLS